MNKGRFFLTRQASVALRDIHAHSLKTWGTKTANRYMEGLYAAMATAAAYPDTGKIRQPRVAPFLMLSAGQHFILYDRIKHGVVILTILHQRRDIEKIVADMTPEFLAEIATLKRQQN